MDETIELQAADGHRFSAYLAGPAEAKCGIVVVQEIFGVNGHIRRVCDSFAEAGYRVVAPALFDRVERGVELGYEKADVKRGMELRSGVPDAGVVADVDAAANALGDLSKGIVGYCWGGTIAWWGATRMDSFRAAVGWYGGGIASAREDRPRCPVQLHFGANDHGISLADVEKIRLARPEVEVFVYEGAGHGFGCNDRASFEPKSAAAAHQRTLDFFTRHLT